jgi:pre-rRNA-processing protein TSR4
MPLLAQLYAPLENTYYDRALYVFACKEAGCRRKVGSVRALRAIYRDEQREEQERLREEEELKVDVTKNAPKSDTKLGDEVFGTSSGGPKNPFASENPFATSNPFESKISNTAKAESEKPVAPAKTADKVKSSPIINDSKEDILAFPCFYIDVEEEILTPKKKPNLSELNAEILEPGTEDDDTSASKTAELGKAVEANMDQVFQKFVDIVENNPEQVVRYQRSLKPLLYSGSDEVAQRLTTSPLEYPRGAHGSRVLELQLMPHAIMVLEGDDDNIANGMEWGTIFVATAEVDALPNLDAHGVGYAEEWVGVQWEEVMIAPE